MSYVEKNLSKSDSVIMKAQVCWLAIIPKLVFGVVLLVIAAVLNDILMLDGISIAAAVVIALINVISTVLKIINTELALSRKKLIGKVGIIKIKSMDSPLNKINNVSVDQGLFGRILNYAKITVSTSSGEFEFQYVRSGDELKNKIMEQIDIYENERIREQAAQMAQMTQAINK